jgi:hypothetical protein
MRLAASIVLSLVWGMALPVTVYKWVDANGVTHYSDQPHPGAQKIEVSAPQTYSAPPPPAGQPAVRADAARSGPAYAICELFAPTPDEVLFNVSTVTAKLRLDPPLGAGHQVTFALDGKKLAHVTTSGNTYTVTPVYRGTHTILAEVTDAQGKPLCRTPAVTFHLRQASMLSPQSPTRPQPPRP